MFRLPQLFTARRFSSSLATAAATAAAPSAIPNKSRLIHFPEIYAELGLDAPLGGSNSVGGNTATATATTSGNISNSPASPVERATAASINALGTVVPHAARPKVDHANSVPVRAWIDGVPVDREALAQVERMAALGPGVIHKSGIVVMPDFHWGNGACVGTVIPTVSGAIIPAAVGVDIGCGLIAVKTSLRESDLGTGSNLDLLRFAIECRIPHGRTHNGQPENDAGGWRGEVPREVARVWKTQLEEGFKTICARRPDVEKSNNISHLGSLGGGNHFCSLDVEEEEEEGNGSGSSGSDAIKNRGGSVWLTIHSGSRGVGARIGGIFIELAKKDMGSQLCHLPNEDLAYLREGTQHFDEYLAAVAWAQRYAFLNRELMLNLMISALRDCGRLPPFTVSTEKAINCHHNYIETGVRMPDGQIVTITRKGATSAKAGELGIIPGSMGAKTFIVRGRGNALSHCSCAHGAGRRYARGEAVRRFTLADHIAATASVACRKDADVIDETPAAYKPIEAVMAAQEDLVEIVARLNPRVVVKG